MITIKELGKEIKAHAIEHKEIKDKVRAIPNLMASQQTRLMVQIAKTLQARDRFLLLERRYGEEIFKNFPPLHSWIDIALEGPEEQAGWFLVNAPDYKDPQYGAFKKMCKSFGLDGNAFHACVRIAKRNQK